MDFEEYPLLHEQNLTTILLRLSEPHPSTLEDALRRLRQDLDIAGEAPPVSDADILEHLARARTRLMIALLLEPVGQRRFRLTERGRKVLAEHPHGVDGSVLITFPEYRDHIERVARPRGDDDPELPDYNEGYAAFQQGRSLTDNPHDWDLARHLAWECGWSTARDDSRPGFSPNAPKR